MTGSLISCVGTIRKYYKIHSYMLLIFKNTFSIYLILKALFDFSYLFILFVFNITYFIK